MGGDEVAIEAAGGMAEPEGAVGTDIALVHAAIERAAGPDGVLVLMDLGSAVITAEMAAEMLAAERSDVRVVLSEAPLVEGAVAAAARAGAGAPLDEVAAEARAAIGMKAAHLGAEPDAAQAAPAATPTAGAAAHEAVIEVLIPLGLHARPAARFVETVARFDTRVTVEDEMTGKGPADASSLSALVMLGARQGHALRVRAEGPDAEAALAALRELAKEGFGDELDGAPSATTVPPPAAPSPAELPAMVEPPGAGDRLTGVPVSPGIAIGPARRPSSVVVEPSQEEPVGDPVAERARLDDAREAARRDIETARAQIAERASQAEAAIFDAHLLLLGDTALLEPAQRDIDAGAGAAKAWSAAVAAAATAYRALDEPYLRERAADVEDVGDRVLRRLTGAPARALVSER